MRVKFHFPAVFFVILILQFIGFIWYSPYLFGNRWLAHVGQTAEELKAYGMGPYGVSFAAALLLTLVLTWLIYKTESFMLMQSLRLGFFLWAGLIAPIVSMHYAFAGKALELILIDVGFSFVWVMIAAPFLASWRKF